MIAEAWVIPSAFVRIDCPMQTCSESNHTTLPPSNVPCPVIVRRIGQPSCIARRDQKTSSFLRHGRAILPMMAPPLITTPGSRVPQILGFEGEYGPCAGEGGFR